MEHSDGLQIVVDDLNVGHKIPTGSIAKSWSIHIIGYN